MVIVPVKSFRTGKQRLSGAMTDRQRHELGKRLAIHVTGVVVEAGQTPNIVTSDPDVVDWAAAYGYRILADPGSGLDAAARAGVTVSNDRHEAWLVVHSDLPLLSSDDVRCLTEVLDAGRSVIAPSSDGGTSAIGSRGPFVFSYGPGSFHQHLPRLDQPEVVARTGLLLDVDSPNDLRVADRTLLEQPS